jgi:hypothetical protein
MNFNWFKFLCCKLTKKTEEESVEPLYSFGFKVRSSEFVNTHRFSFTNDQ